MARRHAGRWIKKICAMEKNRPHPVCGGALTMNTNSRFILSVFATTLTVSPLKRVKMVQKMLGL